MERMRRGTPVPIALALSLAMIGDAFLYAVLPTQAAALGIPLGSVGFLLSINRFIRFFTNESAGRVYGRGERERPFFWATVAGTASTWAYVLPWGFWSFLLARALWGASYSFLRQGNYLAVLERTHAAERGRWLGQVKAITRIAVMAASGLGGYLTDHMGYHFAVGLFGTFTGLGALIAWRELRQARRLSHQGGDGLEGNSSDHGENADRDDVPEDAPPPHSVGNRTETQETPPLIPSGYVPRQDRRRLLVTYLGSFADGLVMNGLVMGTIALLLMQQYGEHITLLGVTVGVATLAGIVLSVRWFTDIVVAPLGGRLADRFSRRGIAILTAFVQVLALIVLAFAAHPLLTIASVCILFAVAVVFILSLESITGEIGMKGDLSTVLSRFSTLQDLGSALGPSLGFSLGIALGLKALYLGAAALLAIVGILFWRETVRRDAPQSPLAPAPLSRVG